MAHQPSTGSYHRLGAAVLRSVFSLASAGSGRRLVGLSGLEALRRRFNQDRGLTRLALLLSPT